MFSLYLVRAFAYISNTGRKPLKPKHPHPTKHNTNNMLLYTRFMEYITRHRLLEEGDPVVLAVSGGVDSVVMAELFKQSPHPFAVAHCNFRLRGKASSDDLEWVRELAHKMNAAFYSTAFDTTSYARTNKLSVQMAARILRYDWLEEIRAAHGYVAVATAHHLDDAIETTLINLIRGTGISGLKGIPKKTNHVIRPLLFATRDDILAFARDKDLTFREDRSNQETKYIRNKLRHQVLPEFKALNPSLHSSMQQFFERMEGTHAIFRMMIDKQKESCMRRVGNEWHILVKPLQKLPRPEIFLYEFLKDFGFSAAVSQDIHASLDRQAGKSFESDTHTALKDRDVLIVYPNKTGMDPLAREIMSGTTQVRIGDMVFRFDTGQMKNAPGLPSGAQELMVDLDLLSFPLSMRPWKAGDKMVPLGMEGHKKVSDLLTGEKIPRHRKKEVLVLVSGGEIVWVAGIRADERFKVSKQTKKYYRVRMSIS